MGVNTIFILGDYGSKHNIYFELHIPFLFQNLCINYNIKPRIPIHYIIYML